MDNDDELYQLAYKSWWATRGWIYDLAIGLGLLGLLTVLVRMVLR